MIDPLPTGPEGLPVLGGYTHDLEQVQLTWVSDERDPLDHPMDLALNPADPSEVWVVSQADNSITVFQAMGTTAQSSRRFNSFGSDHFLSKPSAIAFGANGFFATIHEEDDFTQGPPPAGTPADFMGPTLWPSDLNDFDAGHASHMDMLHNSPNGMGIAWEIDNVYWVFDGYHGALTRYDFKQDHGMGGDDHSDGIIARYAEGEVRRVPGVPSGVELDREARRLYVADTGNNRVAVLDIDSGERGQRLWPNYDGTLQFEMLGATLETVVDGAAAGLEQPAGLALHAGVIYIGDAATGTLHAFDKTGAHLDWLALGLPPGALAGIEVDQDGIIWGVDTTAERLFRLSALPEL